MAHEVRLTTKNLLVGGIDLAFDVKRDGNVLGTLEVSEGGLSWRARNQKRAHGTHISWTEFARWASGT